MEKYINFLNHCLSIAGCNTEWFINEIHDFNALQIIKRQSGFYWPEIHPFGKIIFYVRFQNKILGSAELNFFDQVIKITLRNNFEKWIEMRFTILKDKLMKKEKKYFNDFLQITFDKKEVEENGRLGIVYK